MTDLSKETQLSRSPGGNRRCNETMQLKRSCPCHKCQGWRNQKKGQKGQSKARRALGFRDERFRSKHTNEEAWTSALRVESKAGGNTANPVGLRYLKAREQSDAAKAVGDPRPFVASFLPDDWDDVLLVVKGTDLEAMVYALLEEWSE